MKYNNSYWEELPQEGKEAGKLLETYISTVSKYMQANVTQCPILLCPSLFNNNSNKARLQS